jgi:hypothetical protein
MASPGGASPKGVTKCVGFINLHNTHLILQWCSSPPDRGSSAAATTASPRHREERAGPQARPEAPARPPVEPEAARVHRREVPVAALAAPEAPWEGAAEALVRPEQGLQALPARVVRAETTRLAAVAPVGRAAPAGPLAWTRVAKVVRAAEAAKAALRLRCARPLTWTSSSSRQRERSGTIICQSTAPSERRSSA